MVIEITGSREHTQGTAGLPVINLKSLLRRVPGTCSECSHLNVTLETRL